MRIALGCDHAGFPLKEHLKIFLSDEGHEILDLGTDSISPVDYPAFCAAAARAVTEGDADRAIVMGGSGQGEQIAANKVPGARAALCHDLYLARLSREHNDANVLAMGARVIATAYAEEVVRVWLDTPFAGGRHAARVEQIAQLEREGIERDAERGAERGAGR
jgi:ribose 5-phosphate isomerase B